ncbi:hypothetical protein BU15DRAFT_68026 [Melanogaster broomeanus]|nr:hypothetical protein BU15DRAFT_68026 [Melanogaster broomeanus]
MLHKAIWPSAYGNDLQPDGDMDMDDPISDSMTEDEFNMQHDDCTTILYCNVCIDMLGKKFALSMGGHKGLHFCAWKSRHCRRPSSKARPMSQLGTIKVPTGREVGDAWCPVPHDFDTVKKLVSKGNPTSNGFNLVVGFGGSSTLPTKVREGISKIIEGLGVNKMLLKCNSVIMVFRERGDQSQIVSWEGSLISSLFNAVSPNMSNVFWHTYPLSAKLEALCVTNHSTSGSNPLGHCCSSPYSSGPEVKAFIMPPLWAIMIPQPPHSVAWCKQATHTSTGSHTLQICHLHFEWVKELVLKMLAEDKPTEHKNHEQTMRNAPEPSEMP